MLLRGPAGYYHCSDPDPGRGELAVREGDTKCCQHCGVQRFVSVKTGIANVGGICGHCWEFICEICVRIGSCDPLEEKLRRAEKQALLDEQRYGVSKSFNPYRLPD